MSLNKDQKEKEHLVDIDEGKALQILEKELGRSVQRIDWFRKGYYSRAALIETEGKKKSVVRFGNSSIGYEKDKFVEEHYSSSQVPIPHVQLIKELEDGLWLCVSDFVDGVHSDELHGQEAQTAVESVQSALVALHSAPVDAVVGYGGFDGGGNGKYSSWAEYLTDDFCEPEFYKHVDTDTTLIRQVWGMVDDLAEDCPTERFLVHDDFGSDNLLIAQSRVTAVLDWNSALIGDWVVDIARCQRYPLEVYGDLKVAHENAGFDCSNWSARIGCYGLRSQIGLIHWLWERQTNGLSKWQSIQEAQADLRKMVEGVQTNDTT